MNITKEMCEKWVARKHINPIDQSVLFWGSNIWIHFANATKYWLNIDVDICISNDGHKRKWIQTSGNTYNKERVRPCTNLNCQSYVYLYIVHAGNGDYKCEFCNEPAFLRYLCTLCRSPQELDGECIYYSFKRFSRSMRQRYCKGRINKKKR